MKRLHFLAVFTLIACEDAASEKAAADAGTPTVTARHVFTLPFPTEDGSEIIKMLPSGDRAVLLASKTGRVTLLAVQETSLQELRTVELFGEEPVPGELTHIDISNDGTFGAVTRTIPIEENGVLVDCQGELLLIDLRLDFGEIFARLPVGPMPDGVDISADQRWVVTADEADHFRRCPLESVRGGVTVVELPGGSPGRARVRARITMDKVGDAHREPETIVFGPDDDLVAATLQDTHEVLFFRRSALVGEDPDVVVERPATDFTLTRYPAGADAREPWPDGLHAFTHEDRTVFVATGEFNDSFAFFNEDGSFLSQTPIDLDDLPGDLPRNPDDALGGLIRPDSVAPFVYQDQRYLALSLKYSGAVALYRVVDLTKPEFVAVVRVGETEMGTLSTPSTVSPEGIAGADRGIVVTANEGESSASLIRLETQ